MARNHRSRHQGGANRLPIPVHQRKPPWRANLTVPPQDDGRISAHLEVKRFVDGLLEADLARRGESSGRLLA
jgi:hypothetical protein